jgi:hypothetical protein
MFFKHTRLFWIFSTKLQLFGMLNNNFNSLTLWDSQNPYNPRLNKK